MFKGSYNSVYMELQLSLHGVTCVYRELNALAELLVLTGLLVLTSNMQLNWEE